MKRIGAVVTVCAIICTAAMLRSPITAMGSLSMVVQDDLALSAATMGLLTTLPLLAFAVSSLFMGIIANRFGKDLVLTIGCMLIALGIFVRSSFSGVGLITGTVLLGLGISAGNVLLPAVVKDRFPLAIGALTALYTTTMSIFAGGAAGLSAVIVESGMSWQATLALLVPLAVAGALLWAWLHHRNHLAKNEKPGIGQCAQLDRKSHAEAGRPSFRLSDLLPARIMKTPLTWWITGQFALQSVLFYCMVAWIPSILAVRGISRGARALCMTLFPVMGIFCTIFVPPLAQRLRRQRLLGALAGALSVVGIVLLCAVSSDGMAVFSVALTGFALGAPFCLCMFYFSARTSCAADSARLSSISQTFGYLLAAIGPACMGCIFDMTGSWDVSLVLMIVMAVGVMVCGWKAGTGAIPSE